MKYMLIITYQTLSPYIAINEAPNVILGLYNLTSSGKKYIYKDGKEITLEELKNDIARETN